MGSRMRVDKARDTGLPLSRRKFLHTTAAGAVALGGASSLASMLAACSGSSSSSTSSGSSAKHAGGNLIFARVADPQTIDPSAAIDTESIWTCLLMYECLYTVTSDGHGTKPWLATGYDLSADQRTWTFRLRPNIKFSDGSPLISQDVKFTLERAMKGPNAYILSAIDGIDTPDSGTVVVHTTHPWGPLLGDISMYSNAILPNNLRGEKAAQFFKNPIGTGPFTLKSWTKGQQMVLAKNPHYWQAGKPHLDTVTLVTVPDSNTRILQLRGGQAHITEAPPFSSIASLQATNGIKVDLFPSTAVFFIQLNEKKPQFADAHVRRAISYAIDRDSIVRDVLFGHGSPAASIFSPAWPFYDAGTPKLWYDPATARRELAVSSYPKGFTTTYAVVAGDSLNGSIAQIIQSNLKTIGITMNIQSYDPSTLNDLQVKGDYDMTSSEATLDIGDPDEDVPAMVTLKYGGIDSAYTWYNNAEVLKLTQQAERTVAPNQRASIYAKIQDMVAEQAPLVMLYYAPYAYAQQVNVNGFFVPPTGNYHLEDVTLS
jgi:peptide/nickel transport system substrate-binding protein